MKSGQQSLPIHKELTLTVDNLSSSSRRWSIHFYLCILTLEMVCVPVCVCLVQLRLLLLHDKCYGSHLHPKPEINLA